MKKLIRSITIIATLSVAIAAHPPESFGGLGISVHPGKKGASIASVLPNSPAALAGLQPGDVIISVNGTLLSSIIPENQISLLRGKSGSSVSLQINRGGENISILAKRATISVQDLESSDVSAWFGKSKSLTLEELNYLASQKICENCELLGVMQQGLLINSDIEQFNTQFMQHISLTKEVVAESNLISNVTPATPKVGTFNSANRSEVSFTLASETNFAKITIFNTKGAVVWQKNLGKLPSGVSNINWSGTSLPAGSYHTRLEASGTVLAYKFELR